MDSRWKQTRGYVADMHPMDDSVVKSGLAARTCVAFLAARDGAGLPSVEDVTEESTQSYEVEEVKEVCGSGVAIAPGWRVLRIEGLRPAPRQRCDVRLSGVTQHLGYTSGRERRRLDRLSTRRPGDLAVLIPIVKAERWWSLAQDERQAFFRPAPSRQGHIAIGQHFAGRILRRLYHARYLPDSEWDFLTYFELSRDDRPHFEELLAALRDVRQNPEWQFVEREIEIWMRKA